VSLEELLDWDLQPKYPAGKALEVLGKIEKGIPLYEADCLAAIAWALLSIAESLMIHWETDV
jgi:hypothetical protein